MSQSEEGSKDQFHKTKYIEGKIEYPKSTLPSLPATNTSYGTSTDTSIPEQSEGNGFFNRYEGNDLADKGTVEPVLINDSRAWDIVMSIVDGMLAEGWDQQSSAEADYPGSWDSATTHGIDKGSYQHNSAEGDGSDPWDTDLPKVDGMGGWDLRQIDQWPGESLWQHVVVPEDTQPPTEEKPSSKSDGNRGWVNLCCTSEGALKALQSQEGSVEKEDQEGSGARGDARRRSV